MQSEKSKTKAQDTFSFVGNFDNVDFGQTEIFKEVDFSLEFSNISHVNGNCCENALIVNKNGNQSEKNEFIRQHSHEENILGGIEHSIQCGKKESLDYSNSMPCFRAYFGMTNGFIGQKKINESLSLVQFQNACHDNSLMINPRILGFIPSSFWSANNQLSFGELTRDFFQRKNSINSRFLHKLYNALKIAEAQPSLYPLIGVKWVSDSILKVEKHLFGRLIGIKSVDNSLFHQQGNFPSHGFVELSLKDIQTQYPHLDLTGIDFDDVRLLVHKNQGFVKVSTEESLQMCKWTKLKNII